MADGSNLKFKQKLFDALFTETFEDQFGAPRFVDNAVGGQVDVLAATTNANEHSPELLRAIPAENAPQWNLRSRAERARDVFIPDDIFSNR